jgi:hypothetical protein
MKQEKAMAPVETRDLNRTVGILAVIKVIYVGFPEFSQTGLLPGTSFLSGSIARKILRPPAAAAVSG